MTTSAEVIAELVRRHRAGTEFWISHPIGGRRPMAEIAATSTGFVFADIGWTMNDSGHPFHRVDGVARDLGTVVIELDDGDIAEVFEFDGNDPSDVVGGFAQWHEWLRTAAGKRYVKDGRARFLRLVAGDCASDLVENPRNPR